MSDYAMTITTCGNPDKGQDPNKRLYGVLLVFCKADTLEALRDQAMAFQSEHGIGSGNWTNPRVNLRGKNIGFMSYNGRVWTDGLQEITEEVTHA